MSYRLNNKKYCHSKSNSTTATIKSMMKITKSNRFKSI